MPSSGCVNHGCDRNIHQSHQSHDDDVSCGEGFDKCIQPHCACYPATYLHACVTHAEGGGEDMGSESSYQKGGDDDMQLLEQDMCDDHHAMMDLVEMTVVTPRQGMKEGEGSGGMLAEWNEVHGMAIALTSGGVILQERGDVCRMVIAVIGCGGMLRETHGAAQVAGVIYKLGIKKAQSYGGCWMLLERGDVCWMALVLTQVGQGRMKGHFSP
ncbi:hypothetical protein F5J12DRAFT_782161 [Pisolithus orientalis]|uniref:uncharacterized protein n=1 Tax=Pisolithus orientalis TaxID=936130 RepID=UPI002224D525|nr:uncharacterized protein F5J12DRAFT_782161 [Pisolithus orientalis]KAI6008698.1 hypothetical protein F5J12DRAFT_782161 [Pisolithus orientalis]